MSKKSPSSLLIDEVLASGVTPLLKRHGYRKTGRTYSRPDEAGYLCISVQSGMWNDPTSASFTLNLLWVLPYFHERYTGTPVPKNPASAAPVASVRLGRLLPGGKDVWWQLAAPSDVPEVTSQITEALEQYGLSYLDQLPGRVLEQLRTGQPATLAPGNRELFSAILYTYLGEHDRASSVIRELRDPNRFPGFTRTIDAVESRLRSDWRTSAEPPAS